jgi:hypothetical protein
LFNQFFAYRDKKFDKLSFLCVFVPLRDVGWQLGRTPAM